ncbi:MAG: hypothetical protein C4527_08165 [Candidatus Omnitrophota bacterium]|jgi:hypothetical protein|nr:MAG: hypothetical protein C4527_08165 [Candidatus Omnitrophota bacterium]
MKHRIGFIFLTIALFTVGLSPANTQNQLPVQISWGHESPNQSSFFIKLTTVDVAIENNQGFSLETDDHFENGVWQTQAGNGDIDGVEVMLDYPDAPVKIIQNLHIIWADLITQSDPDTARRLTLDPAYRRDSRKLTIQTDSEGIKGFSVTVDQLLQNKVFWIPSLDIFLSAGDPPVSFFNHQKQIGEWKGKRVLQQVQVEPEATYEQYTSRWEDMGDPHYTHPAQPAPGHIVCLAWDSAIYKFGVDRGAGVWNDLGNPDHFRFWYDFGDLAQGITKTWKNQKLENGLPIIITFFEKNGVRYEVEQFAYPLHGPPRERRGDIPMALLQKVKLTELTGKEQWASFTMSHRRKLAADVNILADKSGRSTFFKTDKRQDILFTIEENENPIAWSGVHDYQKEMKRIDVTVFTNLPANGSREWVVKLPSPVVSHENQSILFALDYEKTREETRNFGESYLSRGAQFLVPENVVNELFRANLWHALRLPRRATDLQNKVTIDLPYSNFAYGQNGTPWPVNQAVYVDYMLYDLRGYHDIALEELAAIYDNNQETNGHVRGYANWVVYTPGMMVAAAKNYLLSQDRNAFETILPQTLKALKWCLSEIKNGQEHAEQTGGLVKGPLNDGTGDGLWAFNQAYIYAGLQLLGRALQQIDHPQAEECIETAQIFKKKVENEFNKAAMRSPLVQLRDHSWIPYVPCEAATFGRIFEQWYPTDVDTGALHLIRLKALPADGELANALLNDHEDNLFLHGWGIANEPVYNQQATAYLLRDDPKAAIRAFYSYMASGFSHTVLEPVEHRWTHGQYFGPPSTDGAWFELYRHMLIHEWEDDSLLLAQATPRAWLEAGNVIRVERAPTYYGKISYQIESRADAGQIRAEIEMPTHSSPNQLLVRLRHPRSQSMQSVAVNGEMWNDYDVHKEWVRIEHPSRRHYVILVNY